MGAALQRAGGGTDEALAIAADSEGSVYVTGPSGQCIQCTGFATIRYSTATGEEVWVQTFNQTEDNRPKAMALDDEGSLIIAGGRLTFTSSSEFESSEFITIKYSQEGGNPNPCNQEVTGFTFVNADTNRDIKPVRQGEVINLAILPTRNLKIRASTTPAMVGSVVFELDGAVVAVENLFPYRFTATDKLTAGTHTLTATPYREAKGGGAGGTARTVYFEVVDLAAESFTLVNADNERDIMPLEDGAVVDLSAMPSRFLSIRADASQTAGIDVVLELSGAKSYARRELGHPYALFGDEGGRYHAWTPAPSRYTLTATPYRDATGAMGRPLTVSFTVVKGLALATAGSLGAASETQATAAVYPNPTGGGRLRVVLPQETQGELAYTLFSPLGAEATSGKLRLPGPTEELELDFSSQMQAPGVYYLRLKGRSLQAVLKVVRQ